MAHFCPSREVLVGYTVGKLPEPAANRVAQHLTSCPLCDHTVAQLDGTADNLVNAIRRQDPDDPVLKERQLRFMLGQLAAWDFVSTDRDRDVSRAGDDGGRSVTGPDVLGLEPHLGCYRLLANLGSGGMGTVYKAIHTNLNKVVALKMLSKDCWGSSKAVERFQRERRAIGKLHHPHIVAAHDAGEADGVHYLVMEFVDGLNLSQLAHRLRPADAVAADPPPENRGAASESSEPASANQGIRAADACELIRQAALGLDHAHRHGLVHRDLKPSNLILGRVGGAADGENVLPVVKILDFGLALLDDNRFDGELTHAGLVMGTLDYMAPEQCDNSHEVDIRADLYSLGATLFRLLTGSPPYERSGPSTPLQRIIARASCPAPSLATRRPDLPHQLVAIVDRLLAVDPNDRLASPGELAEALSPWTAAANLATLLERATESPAAPAAASTTPSDRDAQAYLPNASPNVGPESNRPPRDRGLPRSIPRRLLLLASTAGLILLLAGVYRIATNHGELMITTHDPGIRVTIRRNGRPSQELELRQGATRTRLRTGEVEVVIRGADADKLVARSNRTGEARFSLQRNDRVVVDIVQKPTYPSAPSTGKSTTDDPNRQSADWLLETGARTVIRLQGQAVESVLERQMLSNGEWALPGTPFRIIRIDMRARGSGEHLPPIDDASLSHIAGLTNLAELRLDQMPIGDDGLKHLAELHDLQLLALIGTKISDAGIRHLTALANLEILDLGKTNISNAGLKPLRSLKKIKRLGVSLTQVDDQGLAELKGMRSLELLNLGYQTGITDHGLGHLTGLTNLNSLYLNGTRISDSGIKQLAETLPKLSLLDLRGCSGLTGAAFQHLKALPGLSTLYMDSTSITDEGMAFLGEMPALKELSLSDLSLGDDGVAHLRNLRNLQKLYVTYTNVGDDGIQVLSELPDLNTLFLTNTRVGNRGLEHLRRLIHLRYLDLSGTDVTDEGLRILASLPSLSSLAIAHTAVTEEGIERLKTLRPDLHIIWR